MRTLEAGIRRHFPDMPSHQIYRTNIELESETEKGDRKRKKGDSLA